MTNPIPAPVRAWLYLIGAVVGVVLAGVVTLIPSWATAIGTTFLAALNLLARANVSTPPDATSTTVDLTAPES